MASLAPRPVCLSTSAVTRLTVPEPKMTWYWSLAKKTPLTWSTSLNASSSTRS
ncbi:hypothetical protein [uncultured Dubosiella sp.]|uniref:hypothetical protein n=1 Tax=uncultured Dubosiella sp. TaxID=1937011 RepID=UPI00272ADE2D|nr:hypothetical protein [uncultured Dubosiella sp.]